ncbi:hypothetical protein SY2F82_62080 [Streptomyces sp. Y2F8-2]|nr:hypothetical protein SY2F82_62080 [Streptomyces sp. Y2F8-2]
MGVTVRGGLRSSVPFLVFLVFSLVLLWCAALRAVAASVHAGPGEGRRAPACPLPPRTPRKTVRCGENRRTSGVLLVNG